MSNRNRARTPTPIVSRSLLVPSLSTLLLALAGCAADTRADDVELGEATAALGATPPDVACVRLRARDEAGTGVLDQRVDGHPGTTLSVPLSLPLGRLRVRADGYREACTAALDAATPTWSSAEHDVEIVRGPTARIELELRPSRTSDVAVDFLGWPVSVAETSNTTFVLLDDGTVRAVGSFAWSVASLRDVTEIAAGHGHVCALHRDGTLDCWGDNGMGQLGLGFSGGWYGTPQRVTGLTGVGHVYVSDHATCAVTSSALLYCWGYDANGRLGTGAPGSSYSSPRYVTYGVVGMALGTSHSCILQPPNLACAGANWSGQLGIGTRTDSSIFVGLPLSGVVQVAVGGVGTMARLSDGSVRAWGAIGDVDRGPTPVAFDFGGGVTDLTSGLLHFCALVDGAVRCVGRNTYGEIGNPEVNRATTTPVDTTFPGFARWVRATGSSTYVTNDAGEIWAAGRVTGLPPLAGPQYTPVQLPL